MIERMATSCEEQTPSFITSATPISRKRDASTLGEISKIGKNKLKKKYSRDNIKFRSASEESQKEECKIVSPSSTTVDCRTNISDRNHVSGASSVSEGSSTVSKISTELEENEGLNVKNTAKNSEGDADQLSNNSSPSGPLEFQQSEQSAALKVKTNDSSEISDHDKASDILQKYGTVEDDCIVLSTSSGNESHQENNGSDCRIIDLPGPSVQREYFPQITLVSSFYREFNPYLFIKLLPPYDEVRPVGAQKHLLPERLVQSNSKKKNTLILDLDETLVHCTVDPISNADHKFSVKLNSQDFHVYARKRPGLDRFLEQVSELFEVVVFTASQQVYAEVLLDKLDPQNKFISHRLYRNSCLEVEGNYLKDLNVLGRDLKRTMLVDNSPYAYGYQTSNGIPIESWFDDDEDKCLEQIFPLLKRLSEVDDVQPIIEETFNTKGLIDKATFPDLKF